MKSELQVDPLTFWSSTPQKTFFGNPSFGNRLKDGFFNIRSMDKAILIDKIKRDMPIVKKTLVGVDFIEKEKGTIDLKFKTRKAL